MQAVKLLLGLILTMRLAPPMSFKRQQIVKSDKVIQRIVGLKETEDIKEENLLNVTYINSNCLQITYDEHLSLPDNKDLKKRLKEKVLLNNKRKLVIDCKSTYSTQSNSYILIPTDMILILKENQELEKIKLP